jgi:hypothetical protein
VAWLGRAVPKILMARPAVGAVRRPFLSPGSRRGRNGTGSSRLLSGRRKVVEIALGAARVHVLGSGATRQNEGGRESRGSTPRRAAEEILSRVLRG